MNGGSKAKSEMKTGNEGSYLWISKKPVNWIQCRHTPLSVPRHIFVCTARRGGVKPRAKWTLHIREQFHYQEHSQKQKSSDIRGWQANSLHVGRSYYKIPIVGWNPSLLTKSSLFLVSRHVSIFLMNWGCYPTVRYSNAHVNIRQNKEIHKP
jgi:hypothetical protein